MRSQKLTFPGASGAELSARLDFPPDNRPQAFAVIAHCFTCSKDLRAISNISRSLNEYGIAVLRFDFTGLGESEGEFAQTDFSSNVEDLVAAASFLEAGYEAPSLLVGHSLGGAAVIRAANQLPQVRAVATIGAPCSPEHVKRLLQDSIEDIEATGKARVMIGGRTFTITKQFLDDLDEQDMQRQIALLRRPIIIFHSPVDEVVGIENAQRIYQAARHPKSYISLDRADHLLTDEDDSRYVAHLLAAWARKYLDIRSESTIYGDAGDNRVAARTGPGGYRTEIIANGYPLVADEPESVGGTNTGPTPYDYLAAALGSCTSMTLRMYADHKKWPLESVTTRIRHTRVHVKDCDDCGKNGKRLDRLEREIEVEGDLDDAQRARLVEIANRCPVHKTLTSEIEITTALASEDVTIVEDGAAGSAVK